MINTKKITSFLILCVLMFNLVGCIKEDVVETNDTKQTVSQGGSDGWHRLKMKQAEDRKNK